MSLRRLTKVSVRANWSRAVRGGSIPDIGDHCSHQLGFDVQTHSGGRAGDHGPDFMVIESRYQH